MKKNTTLLSFFFCALLHSQNPKDKIQAYLNTNLNQLELSAPDVSDWKIESEGSSSNTNITNYYIKQRFQGIEIFNAISNVWVKNDEVIHVGNRFVSDVASKATTTTPVLSVLEGLTSAMEHLNITSTLNHEILTNSGDKNFTLSNLPTLEAITAELVYQLTEENTLRLAWDFTIDISGHQHLWNLRIDALDGKLLEKFDLVISCNFGPIHQHNTTNNTTKIAFSKSFQIEKKQSILEVQSGTYNVFPFNIESPNHGNRQFISTPHNTVASPFGWHDTNGAAGNEFTFTRGNNVFAQDDMNGNNGNGQTASGGASLNFNFPYEGTSTFPIDYLDASITNLFYMNNSIHDVWYLQGFNEANGNFQQNNYGRGGINSTTGDAVFADAQDGALANPQNINNANFSTPPDGQRPRMQMFLWNVVPPIEPIFINSPLDIQGPRQARNNVFNPGNVSIPISPELIEADLVLFDDGSPDVGQTDNADGCGNAVNSGELFDKIAVIRRSVAAANGGVPCSFIDKVINAQNAGALAVIIVNNVDGIINMSGANNSIIIPALSVTQEVGEALIARIKIEPVNGKIQLGEVPFVNADGSFDNGIIAHEYGHGISNRLTGGSNSTSCLGNAEQMGEGWSDWFTLIMQLKSGDNGANPRGIGTFAVSQELNGVGIRTYPYSTDMSINPITFDNSNTTAQHARGEFMATVLWDLTWAYVAKYGFDSNVFTGTGGNNKVMKLVIDALKLQPCSPTFIEFRSAIIAADQATTNGQDYCMITEVFRRRGAGLNASSGSRNSAVDQTENFTAFPLGPNCTLNSDYFEHADAFQIYPNPTNGLLTVKINNFIGKTTIQVIDMNGRTVFNYLNPAFNSEQTIDLSSISSGMYVIKVTTDTLDFTKKIIID